MNIRIFLNIECKIGRETLYGFDPKCKSRMFGKTYKCAKLTKIQRPHQGSNKSDNLLRLGKKDMQNKKARTKPLNPL